MGKKFAVLLVSGLLASCSAQPSAAPSNAAGGETGKAAAKQGGAGPSSAPLPSQAPRLATVKPSAEGDAAALEGVLEVAEQCIYINAGGARTLIASAVEGARWDSAEGTLRIGDLRLRPGARIFLGGSFAPLANLGGRWVDAPPQGCATSRVWIASTIRAR